jgi:hypothetical protein
MQMRPPTPPMPLFCVLCDGRRQDLIEVWYSVLSAVHRPTFACRLKLLTEDAVSCAVEFQRITPSL